MSLEGIIALNETRNAFLAEERAAKLSLAVWLVDDCTKRGSLGPVKVFIKEITKILDGKEKPLQGIFNPSGYYLFLDLPDGEHKVRVDSDYYFKHQTPPIKLSDLDPKNPVVTIPLKPLPSYPFAPEATLIRGIVLDIDGEPVQEALIEVAGKDVDNITTDKGEFVLYFKAIKREEITLEIKKYGDIKTVPATIEEGKTISLGIISFP